MVFVQRSINNFVQRCIECMYVECKMARNGLIMAPVGLLCLLAVMGV